MTIYSPYGIRHFDRYITVLAVSEIDIDINDNSPSSTTPFDIVQITGSLKFTSEGTTGALPEMEFKTNNGTPKGVHYRVGRIGTTSVASISSGANTKLKLTTGVDVGVYTPTLSTGFNDVEQFNFNMFLKLSRNSSAPISRVNGWFDSSFEYIDGQVQSGYGGFYIYSDSNIFTITISSPSTSLMGDITVYGLCGDSAD